MIKMEQRKSENTDDMKQITDVTKQNKIGKEVNAISSVCWFCKARLRIHRKVEVIPNYQNIPRRVLTN
ncbi:hypothetical protein T11_17291 [Trichinella zimbabwensis]|uniref:Uncharacterized protein n=1 Tax=Trichinella zimbabwensis TaxID=268475 RepID=A0A0V1HB51_9BILA|nr:hypothetical protein T11_17291 [Trichinella zimbabwensis]